jgi:hypothetical protein
MLLNTKSERIDDPIKYIKKFVELFQNRTFEPELRYQNLSCPYYVERKMECSYSLTMSQPKDLEAFVWNIQ